MFVLIDSQNCPKIVFRTFKTNICWYSAETETSEGNVYSSFKMAGRSSSDAINRATTPMKLVEENYEESREQQVQRTKALEDEQKTKSRILTCHITAILLQSCCYTSLHYTVYTDYSPQPQATRLGQAL